MIGLGFVIFSSIVSVGSAGGPKTEWVTVQVRDKKGCLVKDKNGKVKTKKIKVRTGPGFTGPNASSM